MVIFNLHNVKNAICELSESKKVVIKTSIYSFCLLAEMRERAKPQGKPQGRGISMRQTTHNVPWECLKEKLTPCSCSCLKSFASLIAYHLQNDV